MEAGSAHGDRIFLKSSKERDLISSVLTNSIAISEFLKSNNFSKVSENCQSIVNIMKRLEGLPELPQCYVRLISELTKNISTAGILQVTDLSTLKILRNFCLRELNPRQSQYQKELKQLSSQLPAIWDILLSICQYEKATFLPRDVSVCILVLIKIRGEIFSKSPERFTRDYVKYDKNEDNPLHFYPGFPRLKYPKLYKVSNKEDKEGCTKEFQNDSQFVDGIYTIGNIFSYFFLNVAWCSLKH